MLPNFGSGIFPSQDLEDPRLAFTVHRMFYSALGLHKDEGPVCLAKIKSGHEINSLHNVLDH